MIVLVFLKRTGGEDISVSPFLMGGTTAPQNAYPGIVFLDRTFGNIHCVGTLVNSQHVLTSAQCVTQIRDEQHFIVSPHLIRVIAGDLNFMIPTNNRVIRHGLHIMIHPEYNPFSFENDIAIIRVRFGNTIHRYT